MSSLVADLRYAVRRARHRAGFTLVAVLSLGLGIGVNTAAFTLVDAILIRKTPTPHPEQVVELYEGHDKLPFGPLSYPDYADLRARTQGVFSQISLSRFS